MEKTVRVRWDGNPVEVTIQEISWKMKKDCIRKSIKDVQQGRQIKREVDSILQKELLLLASIKSAPFPITAESLDILKGPDGEKLYNAYAELNEIDPDEESEGESSSGTTSGTESSQN